MGRDVEVFSSISLSKKRFEGFNTVGIFRTFVIKWNSILNFSLPVGMCSVDVSWKRRMYNKYVHPQ